MPMSDARRLLRGWARALFGVVLLASACGGSDGGSQRGAPAALPPVGIAAAAVQAERGLPRGEAGSPLGTNLSEVKDYSPQYITVDAFKQSRTWISGSKGTWDDGRPLALDEHGWIRSLEPGQIARTMLFGGDDLPYPAGLYTVLYEGDGEIQYFANKDVVFRDPGRDVLRADPGKGGITLFITRTNPADPIRNIRVIHPGGTCEQQGARFCDADRPCDDADRCVAFADDPDRVRFHPRLLESLSEGYSVLRFMDWMSTNGSEQQHWIDRPLPSDARWTEQGIPVEIMVELSNTLGLDPWFTMPHQAGDDYVRGFAAYVKANLAPELSVYIEHSNEVWNWAFPQSRYARDQAALDPQRFGSDGPTHLRWHAARSRRIFDIWREEIFADQPERVIRVLAGQSSNAWNSKQTLEFEDVYEHTDAWAIAPYFGGGDLAERIGRLDLDAAMATLRTDALQEAHRDMIEQAKLARRYGVDLIAYEGGQHLVVHGKRDQDLDRMLDAINRDPRMREIYLAYLDMWKDAGGRLFVHFTHIGGYSRHGRWGSMERYDQPRTAAPKYDALMSFQERNARWW
jgi:hypothetical protein